MAAGRKSGNVTQSCDPYVGVWRPLCEVSAGAALAACSTSRSSMFFTELHYLDSVKTVTLNVGALYGTGNAWGKPPRWKCFFSEDKQCEIGRVITDFDVQAQAMLLLMICLPGSIRDLVDALTVKTVTIMLLTNGVRLVGTIRCFDPGGPANTLSRPAWMWTRRGMGRSSMCFCPDWCNSGFLL